MKKLHHFASVLGLWDSEGLTWPRWCVCCVFDDSYGVNLNVVLSVTRGGQATRSRK